MTMPEEKILAIDNLQVSFPTPSGDLQALRGINLFLRKGETLALVGESGSGKSVTARAVMGLFDRNRIRKGTIRFKGKNLLALPEKAMRRIRGNDISMIFQDPMTSLNPTLTIGHQIVEMLHLHRKITRRAAKRQAVELLKSVGIDRPEERLKAYPHQFSGGMRQRAVIAIAIACDPAVLIADEPTTALDVTIQARILDLLKDLKQRLQTSILFITHDLGVVANVADRVAVMYAGKIVEVGTCNEIFYNPAHPYTWGLLCSMPPLKTKDKALAAIPGSIPDLIHPPRGDAFAARNPYAMQIDLEQEPPLFRLSDTHYAATWLLDPRAPEVKPPQEIMRRQAIYQRLVEGRERGR